MRKFNTSGPARPQDATVIIGAAAQGILLRLARCEDKRLYKSRLTMAYEFGAISSETLSAEIHRNQLGAA